MKPYYEDEQVTLYNGDALQVLSTLPENSVDALITDPPYSSGGMFRGDRSQDPKKSTSTTSQAITISALSTGTRGPN